MTYKSPHKIRGGKPRLSKQDKAMIQQIVTLPTRGDRLPVLSMSRMLAMPTREYLLRGVLARGDLSIWWGVPKSGKSFLLLHVGYALSQGRDVFGCQATQTRVIYLALEGQSGLPGRLQAVADQFGLSQDFFVMPKALDLFGIDWTTDYLIDVIRQSNVGFVVIDTLSRIFDGDENGSAAMRAMTNKLDHIRAETGAHIACLHHGTKSGLGSPRGHGSLIGAADLLVEVSKRRDGSRRATITDAKDDEAGAVMPFRLRVVELPPHPDGEARSTCLIDECEAEAIRVAEPIVKLEPGMPFSQRVALDLLHQAIGKAAYSEPPSQVPAGAPAVPLNVWRVACYAGLPSGNSPDAPRQAFHRASQRLQAARLIGCAEGWVWVTP